MFFQMFIKVTFPLSSIITFITCESSYIIVYRHVFSQAASCSKFLVTCLTDEWSLPGVFSCVNSQLCIRYFPPITHVTLVGSLINCMCLQVSGELATLCCSVITLVTFVRSFPGMYSHDVNSEVTFLGCSVVTPITFVRSFTGMYSHVMSQATFHRKPLITYLTDK